MGTLRRLSGVIHILHDEKIELLRYFVEITLIDPRVRGVSGDDPEPLYFAVGDSLYDLIVSPTVLIWNPLNVYAKNLSDFRPMLGD